MNFLPPEIVHKQKYSDNKKENSFRKNRDLKLEISGNFFYLACGQRYDIILNDIPNSANAY
jgi:hypothetical protein